MAISEHEVLTFERVKNELEDLGSGIIVTSTGPLAEALGQLGCFPYTKVPCKKYDLKCKLSIAGKPAGTFGEPDVELILQESAASSFGRGETTVMDPAYRLGQEIPARNIEISKGYLQTSEHGISTAMFVGKSVELKLYKLAVYQEGGHFDWHMDSTHSDQHHATLLLALNTSWEGGDLKLRRNGIETLVDMHPKADQGGSINLQAAAFFTDTEHKVEPVTKGIRIVLQFDVEVVGWGEALNRDDEDEDEGDQLELFYEIENISNERKRYQESLDSISADNAIVTKVTDIVRGLLEGGKTEVAFAMQYLYRKSSILPEFLKGTDAQLYHALVGTFDVTLRPVVLHSSSDYEGCYKSFQAITWDQDTADAGSGAETFHLPIVSAIQEISCKEYIEYTGNEAQLGEKKYFGGGMFVRKKEDATEQ